MQTLDYAGEHLLAPGARVVPARIRIFGAVAEVGRIGRVRGLDLSPINVYRWYPHHEPIDLHKVPVRCVHDVLGPSMSAWRGYIVALYPRFLCWTFYYARKFLLPLHHIPALSFVAAV